METEETREFIVAQEILDYIYNTPARGCDTATFQIGYKYRQNRDYHIVNNALSILEGYEIIVHPNTKNPPYVQLTKNGYEILQNHEGKLSNYIEYKRQSTEYQNNVTNINNNVNYGNQIGGDFSQGKNITSKPNTFECIRKLVIWVWNKIT